MFPQIARTLLTVSTAALLLAAAIPAAALAVSPTVFDVSRVDATTYRTTSDTGIVYTGTLKLVVEKAVSNLNAVGGGRIQFGTGTYDLGAQFFRLHNVSHIVFAGAGMTTTTIRNRSDAAADTEPFNMSSVSFIEIRDMTVAARGALRTTSDVLDFDNGNDSSVINVRITSSRSRGIIFDGKDVGWSADRNLVQDCVITNLPGVAIELLGASNNRITGCEIRNAGRSGINVTKASSVAATPNKPSDGNIITWNTVTESGADGITVNSSNRNVITDNTITNSANIFASRDGIKVGSTNSIACNDNAIQRNVITDTQAEKTQRYGVYIQSSLCARTLVAGNTLTGNKSGPIRDLGTGTLFSN